MRQMIKMCEGSKGWAITLESRQGEWGPLVSVAPPSAPLG